MKRSPLFPLILLIAIASGSLFFRLGALPLNGADEPRYARIAEEMHNRHAWVTPTLQDKPWMEKPPLYYWITSPLYSIFHTPETAARLGPALCALITALAVFWIGSMLWTRLAGFISALILLTSLGVAGFGRSASTDMPFTCALTLALAILALAVEKDIGWKVLAGYVFLGLAVLGKGPVALILAFGIGLCFWFLHERGGALRRWHVCSGLLIAALIAIPWFYLAFRQNGYAFIATFFINHNLARYTTDIHHHSQPFYYYLPVILALFFPWSGWLLTLISKSPLDGLRRWRSWNSGMLFMACWFLFPMLFFSLSGSKLAGYVLPSLPPLALILGVRISRGIQGESLLPKLRAGMLVHLILSAGMAIAAPIFFQKDYGGNWKVGLLLSVAILIPAIFAYGFRRNIRAAFGATVLQGFLTVVFVALFAFPVLGGYHSTRTIAHQALALRHAEEPILTYRFFHHSLHYYTNYQVENRLDDWAALKQYAAMHPSFLVVTKAAGMQEIINQQEITARLLAKQGNFLLLRLSRGR